ncbi:MAG TPA: recombinase family protein [Methyloceanibacter sp.]|nr:recombinase family protein [Methyloceanibacter sp.]
MSKTPVRCAIYTRKSSDEGLEQAFNSLDAQREACAAYVASQKGQGWRLLPHRYDDGGVSGGTLERPGLHRLLSDIEAGKVDLVVVYKVDRLTRSLADFAKLVERFDRAGVSFVSVTQQFNTATSMGRLTLNVLLSFAQFEREVTAERIRDKIAASKKKGLWMGGRVPLGYDVEDRTLVVNEAEAQTVQTIFQLYLELGCARRVKDAADRQGLVTKYRRCGNGKTSGGVAFTRGRIYHLVANPIYVGEIRHKRFSYPGQHPAIIDRATFEAVNLRLKANASRVKAPTSAATHAPLVGKLTDETGDRLTPSHAMRRGKRYCYYVSRRLVAGSGKSDMRGWRLPAAALEGAVARLIIDALEMPSAATGLIDGATPEMLTTLPPAARSLCSALSGPDRGPTLRAIVASARIEPGRLSVTLCSEALAARLGVPPAQINRDALSLVGEFTLRRRGVQARLVLANTPAALDRTLVKTVALGWAWFEEIKTGATMQSIADREGITQRRVAHLVDLAFLAPDIVRSIVEGRQPPMLTADRLIKSRRRMLWSDQRTWLSAI